MSNKIVDLEEIMKIWGWNLFMKTRSKAHSSLQYDDVRLEVNWSRVRFAAGKPNFTDKVSPDVPSTQVVFKSIYVNHTSNDQENSFKTERTTTSSCTTSITKGFSKGFSLELKLALPQEVAEATVGFGKEVNMESTEESSNEQSVTWSVDSTIRVPPKTKTTAELEVKEQQFGANFKFDVVVKGRVLVVVTNLKDNNSFVQSIEGEFADILKKEMDKGRKGFVVEGKYVKWDVEGKCDFRYGIEQHVKLTEDKA